MTIFPFSRDYVEYDKSVYCESNKDEISVEDFEDASQHFGKILEILYEKQTINLAELHREIKIVADYLNIGIPTSGLDKEKFV